jgi:SAM-dependent methyltransferase
VTSPSEPYLLPYLRAAERHGDGFGSLLWASPRTQRARFNAIRKACDPKGNSLLDVGCGRADLLEYLVDMDARPAEYVGLEMVPQLAAAARRRAKEFRHRVPAMILRADFVREPARMFVGADIVAFSGSLNTLDEKTFYATLERAYEAATEAIVFNFLCSPVLAGQDYLVWHESEEVLRFAEGFGGDVRIRSDYLGGDCTICLDKTRSRRSFPSSGTPGEG